MKPDLRKEMWQGDLKRCFFCTPQTFWNDVRRGGCVGHGGVTALLVAASQGCLLPGRCPRGRGPLALYIHATVWADNAAAASISRTCAVACRHLPLRQGGVPCCGRVPPRHRCARRPLAPLRDAGAKCLGGLMVADVPVTWLRRIPRSPVCSGVSRQWHASQSQAREHQSSHRLRLAGKHDVVHAVQHMRQHKCRFRVLGLSATPGADGAKVQVRGGQPGRADRAVLGAQRTWSGLRAVCVAPWRRGAGVTQSPGTGAHVPGRWKCVHPAAPLAHKPVFACPGLNCLPAWGKGI